MEYWKTSSVWMLVLAAICGSSQAAYADKEASSRERSDQVDPALQRPLEPDSQTEGSVTVNGHAIAYKAIAGTLAVGATDAQDQDLDADGLTSSAAGASKANQAAARMFYVAYFRKGAGAERPVAFIYNGGPGAASMLLHMGAFGPRRVIAPDGVSDTGAPYRVVNNDYSLLDVSDLVFIDAPGTGFGRLTGPDKERAFWGNDPDAHAFDRFVRRFLTRYDRWSSPKFLIGESYGTLRNAQLAATLQNVSLSGIVMLSQLLSFGDFAETARFTPGQEQAYALALPSYAAVAFHYHKLPSQPPALQPFLVEVEQFALGEYMSALLQGSELTPARKAAVAEKLHAYTGLPVSLLLKADLRVSSGVFAKNLLLDEAVTIGTLDARYEGPDLDPLEGEASYDPLVNSIMPAYAAAANEYLRTQLKYGRNQTYRIQLGDDDHFKWDWRHGVPGGPSAQAAYGVATNVMPDLAYAMKLNPKMKVMLAGGYFDLATPFFAGIYEMHHLPIPQALQANITYHQYMSGHVVYLNEAALQQFHSDVAAFIAEGGGASHR
jgi:carboxypeptidase C (cathepsin A)